MLAGTVLGSGLQTGLRAIADGRIGEPPPALAVMQASGSESWHPRPEYPSDTGGGPLSAIGPYYPTALALVFGPVGVTGTSGSVEPHSPSGTRRLAKSFTHDAYQSLCSASWSVAGRSFSARG
jgi:predicted dehydrogenase